MGIPNPEQPPRARSRPHVPLAVWGPVLLLGGAMVWWSTSADGHRAVVPDVWRVTVHGKEARESLQSTLRPGRGRGDLLKLWWPDHPRAEAYRVVFRDAAGAGPEPVTVRSNIFLYDMQSNVLDLPGRFTWEVTAVLPDGSEVRTPPRRYPAD